MWLTAANATALAREIVKDPYNFEFLGVADDAHERHLERGLLEHLRAFLLELGVGFAFVGSQHRLVVGGEESFVDLLFYHHPAPRRTRSATPRAAAPRSGATAARTRAPTPARGRPRPGARRSTG